MPYIRVDEDIDLSVDDFLSACSNRDIKELIKYLREDGHLKDADFQCNPSSAMESFYENSLNKLHGAYHILGTEDIETIERIAKRF